MAHRSSVSSSTPPPSLLAAVMLDRGLTQRELIRLTGLPSQTVNDAYHGHAGQMETYITIARALGVSLASIAPSHAERLNGLAIQ